MRFVEATPQLVPVTPDTEGETDDEEQPLAIPTKKRGRPLGSKNFAKYDSEPVRQSKRKFNFSVHETTKRLHGMTDEDEDSPEGEQKTDHQSEDETLSDFEDAMVSRALLREVLQLCFSSEKASTSGDMKELLSDLKRLHSGKTSSPDLPEVKALQRAAKRLYTQDDENQSAKALYQSVAQPQSSVGRTSESKVRALYHETDRLYSASEDNMECLLSAAAYVSSSEDYIPATFSQAMACDEKEQWNDAMAKEMDSLKQNKTWTLVPRPKGRKVIRSKWVFAVKRKPDGTLIKFKARQVAKGFSQVEGVDYTSVFAPVARSGSIRTVLSLAASQNMKLTQFDVCTAFLYGDLDEEIFMEQPDGFNDGTDRVCRLQKGLYGLKQASRQWNLKFIAFLEKHGLKRSAADPCVYTAGNDMIVCLYVDDGLICCKSDEKMQRLIKDLKKEFKITTSDVSCFVGLEIEQHKDQIIVHQRGYIRRMLEKFQMQDCKPATTPAEGKVKLTKGMAPRSDQERTQMSSVPYREAVGSLMYAAVSSRPDISFIVGKLAKFVENPGPGHWQAAKRVFRYLKGTQDHVIRYKRGCSRLTGFCDSDWVGDQDDRRSTTGFVFVLNGGPITSRSQTSVALSTLEAEYMAMSEATKEGIWLRSLLMDLGHEQKDGLSIRVDNQSAIKLCDNAEFHNRSKHIDIRYHFVRDESEKGTISFDYIASQENAADVFTKSLCAPTFNHCLEILKIKSGRGTTSQSQEGDA